MFEGGLGVGQSYSEAIEWYGQAAAQQNYPGATRQRMAAERSLSRGELREADALVEQWKPEIPQVLRTAPE